METKQHELIYFNNIPVQKVSGSVFGKFNFGSGNVSGQISTTDEISYWYLVGDNTVLYASAPTDKSLIKLLETETEKPYVEITEKTEKFNIVNHNDNTNNYKISKG